MPRTGGVALPSTLPTPAAPLLVSASGDASSSNSSSSRGGKRALLLCATLVVVVAGATVVSVQLAAGHTTTEGGHKDGSSTGGDRDNRTIASLWVDFVDPVSNGTAYLNLGTNITRGQLPHGAVRVRDGMSDMPPGVPEWEVLTTRRGPATPSAWYATQMERAKVAAGADVGHVPPFFCPARCGVWCPACLHDNHVPGTREAVAHGVLLCHTGPAHDTKEKCLRFPGALWCGK
jgi:hypothetical protein